MGLALEALPKEDVITRAEALAARIGRSSPVAVRTLIHTLR